MELNDLFAALGLAMALEGIAYALFPDAMRRRQKSVAVVRSQ